MLPLMDHKTKTPPVAGRRLVPECNELGTQTPAEGGLDRYSTGRMTVVSVNSLATVLTGG